MEGGSEFFLGMPDFFVRIFLGDVGILFCCISGFFLGTSVFLGHPN